MKIFITGASGFVGSATLAYLCRSGNEVTGMSRKKEYDEEIIAKGGRPLRCNLEDISKDHLLGMDVVIHTAAFIGQWGSYKDFYKVNVTGTERLLYACLQAGVKKLIYISTESVVFCGRDLVDIDESYPYPQTPYFYSTTKQLAEVAVLKANINGTFETICLRPRMIWGPGDHTLLPLIKAAAAENKFLWINGGHYHTSTTHIDNLVHAISLSIVAATGGSVYFITDDSDTELRNFFTQLLATQNMDLPNKSIPKIFARFLAFLVEKIWLLFRIKGRPPVTRFGAAIFSCHCTLKIKKAKSELKYEPVITIKQGLAALRAY